MTAVFSGSLTCGSPSGGHFSVRIGLSKVLASLKREGKPGYLEKDSEEKTSMKASNDVVAGT